MEKLGIDVTKLDFKCPIKPTKFNEFSFGDDDIDDDEYDDDEEPVDYLEYADVSDNDIGEDCTLSNITGELEMRDYSKTGINLGEEDRLAIVVDSSGKEKVVRKSGIVYLMLQDRCKLSSDRLQRVMERNFVGENGLIFKLYSEAK